MSHSQLMLTVCAEALFASPLQESQEPGARIVRAAVSDALDRYSPDYLVGVAAQEAGDHPDLWQRRMQWALRAVSEAYRPRLGSRI